MKEERLIDLVKTLSVQTTSYNTKKMIKFIKKEVSKIPGCVLVEDKENIYVTRGKAKTYPCMVAHTDTVHKLVKNFRIYRSEDKLFSIDGSTMRRVGIGGDDKVGVFIALEMLRNTEVCKAVFFRDEEVGCKGSAEADMRWFDDVEFALQCDRKGAKDFVNNIYGNIMYDSAFSAAIGGILKKYGRKEVDGGVTDVGELVANGLPIAAANMSCGYYDPHTDNEYVVISEIEDTYEMCKEIVDGLSGERWEVSEKDRYLYNSHSYGYGFLNSWGNNRGAASWELEETERDKAIAEIILNGGCCPHCDSAIGLEYDDYADLFYCFDCDQYTDVNDVIPFYGEYLQCEGGPVVVGIDEEEWDFYETSGRSGFADESDVVEMEAEAKRLGASKGKSTKRKGKGGKSDLSKLANKL